MSEDQTRQSVDIHSACDPGDLHAMDQEAVEYDDDDMDESDWEEIYASTEEDARNGNVAFTTAGCPDDETARKALRAFLDSILAEVLCRVAATPPGMASSR